MEKIKWDRAKLSSYTPDAFWAGFLNGCSGFNAIEINNYFPASKEEDISDVWGQVGKDMFTAIHKYDEQFKKTRENTTE